MFTPDEYVHILKEIKLSKNFLIKTIRSQMFSTINTPGILEKYLRKITKDNNMTYIKMKDSSYDGCRIEPFEFDDSDFKYLFRILEADNVTVKGFYIVINNLKDGKYYLYCIYSYNPIIKGSICCGVKLKYELQPEKQPLIEKVESDIAVMEEIRTKYNIENYINGNSILNILMESDCECKSIARLDDIKTAIKRMSPDYINNLLGRKFTTNIMDLTDSQTSMFLTRMSENIANIKTDSGEILTMIIIDDWTYLCAKDLTNNQLVLIPLCEDNSNITIETMLLLNLIQPDSKSVRIKRINFNGAAVDENEVSNIVLSMKKNNNC